MHAHAHANNPGACNQPAASAAPTAQRMKPARRVCSTAHRTPRTARAHATSPHACAQTLNTKPYTLKPEAQHTFTGAVDLLPFHPFGGASMEDAARTSRTVAERVGRELGNP